MLGFSGGQGYALLYNGILGDKTPKGGNVLTGETLSLIRQAIAKKRDGFDGTLTILWRSIAVIGFDAGPAEDRF